MLGNWELIARLVIAGLLGGVIGFERERLSWAAGLRTHMLVCVGSTLMMIVSAYGFNEVLRSDVVLDPSRMAAQVVSGIGFLGAGAILARGEVIRGLTTAASVWAVAGVGLAVGGGLYTAAVAATVIMLVILAGVKPLEKRFIGNRRRWELVVYAHRDALSVVTLHDVLEAGTVRVKQLIVKRKRGSDDLDEINIVLSRATSMQFEAMCERLREVPGVQEVKESDTNSWLGATASMS